MKNWFAKFKLSAALDDGNMPPAVSHSEDIRKFAQDTLSVHATLRAAAAPAEDSPVGLHAAIMRKIRASDETVVVRSRSIAWRPVLAGLSLAAVVCISWRLLHWAMPPENISAGDPQSLAAAGSALELGNQVARMAPAALVSPLSEELERLSQDLDRTTEFILASLP